MQHSTYDVTRWRSHPYILERALSADHVQGDREEMGRSDTLNPAAGKNSGTASVEAWFAGGERFGYDPTAAAIVASAPLKVFLRCEGDLADAVSFLPGYPDGSFGWAKI